VILGVKIFKILDFTFIHLFYVIHNLLYTLYKVLDMMFILYKIDINLNQNNQVDEILLFNAIVASCC